MKKKKGPAVAEVTLKKWYTCDCGKTMERNMRVIRAHVTTECPNVKRRI